MRHRVRQWQSLLGALFAERAQDHFEWGRNDCALFAADCVLTATGFDPAAEFRGKYATEREALRLLKETNLEKLADRWFPRLPSPLAATSGDIGLVMVKESGLEAFVVCGGGQWWYGPAENGLAPYPRSDIRIAWGIGR